MRKVEKAICTKSGECGGCQFTAGDELVVCGWANGIHLATEDKNGCPVILLCYTYGDVHIPVECGDEYYEPATNDNLPEFMFEEDIIAGEERQQMITINYKKLHPAAVAPKQAYKDDAGFDLTVTSVKRLGANKVEYGFGIAVEIPEGYEGEIRPRSSVHKNFTLLSNSPGTIDAGFRGEVKAVFYHIPFLSKPYAVGERACQLLIKPVPEVRYIEAEELSETQRGTGGYGSTGI